LSRLEVAPREPLLVTVDHLHVAYPQLAAILVTPHLEELPETTTHAALIGDGKILAAGAATEVSTTEPVSECFAYPIKIEHDEGRWRARAAKATQGSLPVS